METAVLTPPKNGKSSLQAALNALQEIELQPRGVSIETHCEGVYYTARLESRNRETSKRRGEFIIDEQGNVFAE
ncbi:MAG: hypothetical protein D6816_00625 [Bacteroidetes bacterium]|nr:MAG: hypothetical protein D6816_00625 [Bacteroidota bacterium]